MSLVLVFIFVLFSTEIIIPNHTADKASAHLADKKNRNRPHSDGLNVSSKAYINPKTSRISNINFLPSYSK